MLVIKRGDEVFEIEDKLPLLPLRDVVIFPYMTVPLLVGRVPSVNAIEEAVAGDRMIFVATQKRPEITDPTRDELYRVGCVAKVLQLSRHPNGTLRVLVEGICRGRVRRFHIGKDIYYVNIGLMKEDSAVSPQTEALMRSAVASFGEYARLSKKVPDEVFMSVSNMTDATILAHTIAANLNLKVAPKQEILEIEDATERLKALCRALSSEVEILKLERKIEGQVRSQVHKNQKEFYLNEQLKAIRKELGYQNEFANELEELSGQIKKARMPKEVHEKAMKELDRLSKMSFMSPEATVVRNYIDWLVALPWCKVTDDILDIEAVEKVLNEDHYGLQKVKERILEYISVLKLTGALKGPIICFVGPPGVGKTSLGKSIARALGRKFIRMSLGGVRDEAEIRGHRRTYIGSMPGRIIQSLKRAGSMNPVFLLDEVDKLGVDFRGDPASALLEVLDPEQNCTFTDHYLEVEFDLSQVMFITTANVLHTIPPALQDRMEILRLPGYLEYEKMAIAKFFLIPKQLKANGLTEADFRFTSAALASLISQYTREAGVRSLEREIASVARKIAKRKAAGKAKARVTVTKKKLEELLGAPKYIDSVVEQKTRTGIATGLAWTEAGGDVLTVEVSVLPGRGELLLTGKLGEIMRESGQAALSYARSRATILGLDKSFYKEVDVHVHVPEGAMPKDGPSAGITMVVALVSALTGVPTRKDVAMTGEITLRGNVLPVGGLNEKLVAARRAGITTVLIPKMNEREIRDIPAEVRNSLNIVGVETMDEVLKLALVQDGTRLYPSRDDGRQDQAVPPH